MRADTQWLTGLPCLCPAGILAMGPSIYSHSYSSLYKPGQQNQHCLLILKCSLKLALQARASRNGFVLGHNKEFFSYIIVLLFKDGKGLNVGLKWTMVTSQLAGLSPDHGSHLVLEPGTEMRE